MASSRGVVPLEHVIYSPEVDFSKPLDTANLKDKTIVITGGASGLGAGYFKTWAPHGANIIIGDINEADGTALTESLRASTGNKNLHFLKLDVLDWQNQVLFFREAAKLSPHGGIDCVIVNAGIANGAESEAFENPPNYTEGSHPDPPKLKQLDINLTAAMYTTNLALSYLSRNPGSEKCSVDASSAPRDRHLILIASIAGLMPIATQSIYATSKHAIVGLFRALRLTTPVIHGIRVNMICPYFVLTPILGVSGSAIMAGGAVATVEDVVDAATRLVIDQSIIGRALIVGPKANMSDARKAGFEIIEEDGAERAVWDVYGHDFEQSDIFSRRVLAITNLMVNQKGWATFFTDIGSAFVTPVKRWFGY